MMAASACDLELHAHGLLRSRCSWYLSQHDYESAVWLGERMATTLREQIRIATEQALEAQAQAVAEAQATGAGAAATAAASAEALDTSTLLSLSQSLESVHHLLATAQYHWQNARRRGGNGGGGGANAAYQLLRDAHTFTEQNQFLFALACLDLQRYAEAEQVLLANAIPNPEPSQAPAGVDLSAAPDVLPPMGSQGLLLLGRICHTSSRREEAAAFYRRALMADRLCFAAYNGLCTLGALDQSTIGSDFFRIDPAEIAAFAPAVATEQGGSVPTQHQAQHPSAHQAPMLSPERTGRAGKNTSSGANAHLLATPASAMVPHMHTLSLGGRGGANASAAPTPTPRQALFTTPFARTGGGGGGGGASAHPHAHGGASATPASPSPSPSFVTPPPHGSPLRGVRGGQAFASPPSSSAKPRPRGHVRAHSAAATPLYSSFASSSSATAAAASSSSSVAAAVGTASARMRKVASRLNWESDTKSARPGSGSASAAAGAGSEYSSDDASSSGAFPGHSERERNEKKVGRRINRGQTPGEKVAHTPRAHVQMQRERARTRVCNHLRTLCNH